MNIRNQILMALGMIAFIIFLLYELSLSGMMFQAVGAVIAIISAVFVLKMLSGKNQANEDDMLKAEKYAIELIKERTGADVGYADEQGATRTFTDADGKTNEFFAFQKKRFEGIRPIFYLIIIRKPEYKPLKLFRFIENPTDEQKNDIFGINAGWSIIIGNPKFAKSYGAPVKIREELYGHKPATGQTINVGIPDKSEDTKEKEKMGLK